MANPGPNPRVSDEELLATLRDSEEPALTTRDVADRVPLTRRYVHSRLTELHEQDLVETNGGERRPRIWWAA